MKYFEGISTPQFVLSLSSDLKNEVFTMELFDDGQSDNSIIEIEETEGPTDNLEFFARPDKREKICQKFAKLFPHQFEKYKVLGTCLPLRRMIKLIDAYERKEYQSQSNQLFPNFNEVITHIKLGDTEIALTDASQIEYIDQNGLDLAFWAKINGNDSAKKHLLELSRIQKNDELHSKLFIAFEIDGYISYVDNNVNLLSIQEKNERCCRILSRESLINELGTVAAVFGNVNVLKIIIFDYAFDQDLQSLAQNFIQSAIQYQNSKTLEYLLNEDKFSDEVKRQAFISALEVIFQHEDFEYRNGNEFGRRYSGNCMLFVDYVLQYIHVYDLINEENVKKLLHIYADDLAVRGESQLLKELINFLYPETPPKNFLNNLEFKAKQYGHTTCASSIMALNVEQFQP